MTTTIINEMQRIIYFSDIFACTQSQNTQPVSCNHTVSVLHICYAMTTTTMTTSVATTAFFAQPNHTNKHQQQQQLNNVNKSSLKNNIQS